MCFYSWRRSWLGWRENMKLSSALWRKISKSLRRKKSRRYLWLFIDCLWQKTKLMAFISAQMFNRLTKSAELQARVDEEYFNTNMEGHHIRLKLENTLKTCYQVQAVFHIFIFLSSLKPLHFDWFSAAFQIVQELEKQRIETLSNALDKYSLFMTVYAQTVIHVSNSDFEILPLNSWVWIWIEMELD